MAHTCRLFQTCPCRMSVSALCVCWCPTLAPNTRPAYNTAHDGIIKHSVKTNTFYWTQSLFCYASFMKNSQAAPWFLTTQRVLRRLCEPDCKTLSQGFHSDIEITTPSTVLAKTSRPAPLSLMLSSTKVTNRSKNKIFYRTMESKPIKVCPFQRAQLW